MENKPVDKKSPFEIQRPKIRTPQNSEIWVGHLVKEGFQALRIDKLFQMKGPDSKYKQKKPHSLDPMRFAKMQKAESKDKKSDAAEVAANVQKAISAD